MNPECERPKSFRALRRICVRNISFMLTTRQVCDRIKTVTRRNGWLFAKPGDLLCAVEKSQGLGKGGKIVRVPFQ
jgi:hypothetical protein